MRIAPIKSVSVIALASLLGACAIDVGDLNNPSIDDLQTHPTVVTVNGATTGLVIGNRGNFAASNGYVVQLGILGREAYDFDASDPRYINELLAGALNQGSPFGGNFWALQYANIRLANVIQTAVGNVPDYTAAERSGILGFSKTMQALDLLEVVVTHDTNGAVIDTARDARAELAPIVDRTMAYAKITQLLDDAKTDLAAAGDAFAFPLSTGYAHFDAPKTFLKFNRAIRARVAVYTKDYGTALTALSESFVNTATPSLATLNDGVYHSYSTGAGDLTNGLINPNIYVHPSLKADAMMNGATVDARFTRKTATTDTPGSSSGLTSNVVFTLYTAPNTPVPIIRNEELILLRAEALFFTTDVPGAVTALNIVRQTSGGLAPIVGTPTEQQFVDALLYERRYSLMFEGGHRWIDVRRFDRTADLPLDLPNAHKRNIRYPLPLTECNARPGEPACALGSL